MVLFIKNEKLKMINNKFKILTSIFIVLLMTFNMLNIIVVSESGQLKLFVKKEKQEELEKINENIAKIHMNDEKKEIKSKEYVEEYSSKENIIERNNKQEYIVRYDKNTEEKRVSSYKVERDNTDDCKEGQVVITVEGKKYHKPNCGSIKHVKGYVTADEAERIGYSPCRKCYPC